MEEFPGNSKKQKTTAEPEKKVVTKVISGKAVRKKTPVGTKFRRIFVSSDDSRGVWEFIFTEHIIPGGRDMIYDALNAGLHRKLYGEGPARRAQHAGISTPWGGTLTNYAGFSRGPAGSSAAPEPPRLSRRARATHDFGEIIIPTKPEAELILETMYEIIGRHEECTVADLMQMLGETPEFTQEKWGWTNLEGSRPRRAAGGGYVLELPPTESLV